MAGLKNAFKNRKSYWYQYEKGKVDSWLFFINNLESLNFLTVLKFLFRVVPKFYLVIFFIAFIGTAKEWAVQDHVQVQNWFMLAYIIPGYVYSTVLLISAFVLSWMFWFLLPVEKISVRESLSQLWSTVGLWTASGFIVGIVAMVVRASGWGQLGERFGVWDTVLYISALFGFLGVPVACVRLISSLGKKFYCPPMAILFIPFIIWITHSFIGYITGFSISPEQFFNDTKSYYMQQIVEYFKNVSGEAVSQDDALAVENKIMGEANYGFLVPLVQIAILLDIIIILAKDEINKWVVVTSKEG